MNSMAHSTRLNGINKLCSTITLLILCELYCMCIRQNKSPSGWQGRLPGWFAPYNVQVHNGSLQLFARHENITDPNLKKMGYANFTTSFVASQRPVRYGYFEIRARVGSSKVSSSFWFYNSNTTAHHWTEIDVFEMTGEHASQQLSTQDAMHTHVFMLPKENTSFLPDLCDCSLPHETVARVAEYIL
eukprot:TRINITY_DN10308_c0_g1_i7.p1 TRINITY_DN10308_c0_g1~~TRINITY_DN10308_c0_g1_i7.p1  ORF type:complete len:187 (+),score=3.52 TRINITY_DN10308_c0_g1_i7:167-727(+)